MHVISAIDFLLFLTFAAFKDYSEPTFSNFLDNLIAFKCEDLDKQWGLLYNHCELHFYLIYSLSFGLETKNHGSFYLQSIYFCVLSDLYYLSVYVKYICVGGLYWSL